MTPFIFKNCSVVQSQIPNTLVVQGQYLGEATERPAWRDNMPDECLIIQGVDSGHEINLGDIPMEQATRPGAFSQIPFTEIVRLPKNNYCPTCNGRFTCPIVPLSLS